MKKFALALALVAFAAANSFAAAAAEKNLKAGIKVGVGLTNQKASYNGDSESVGSKVGFQFGGFAEVLMGKSFAIQPELLFAMKGSKDDADVSYKFNYIQIPVLAKYRLGNGEKRFTIFAGPSLGLLMSAKASYEGESVDIKDSFNGTDFSGVFGVGAEIDKFQVDVRYDLGLSNILKDAPDDFSYKNNGVYLTLGYSFI